MTTPPTLVPMARPLVERRASYGPNSPIVGERGGRTRQTIVDATLRVFDDQGLHATVVDDIARAANVSRATLYQYFASKEAIFVELVEESGAALMRVAKDLGPLAPDAAGFRNLHDWLTAWAAVFDKYATIFVQWATVNAPQEELHGMLRTFLDAHSSRLSATIAAAAPPDVDPAAAAVLFLSVLERGHYLRHLYWHEVASQTDFTDDLAIAFQLYLFPQTSQDVFGPRSDRARIVARSDDREAPSQVAVTSRADDVRHLSEQGRRTAQRLLDSGAQVIAANGFASASVEQVVTRAGVARGTFYKYFDDRLDLLRTLAVECAAALDPLCDEFAEANTNQLTSWLERFLTFQRHYAGVLRVWTERSPDDPAIAAASRRTADRTVESFRRLRSSIDGSPVVRRAGGSMILLAMLEHFPGRSTATRFELDDQQIIEAQRRLLAEALLRTRLITPPRTRSGRPG
jgi:AcrR family transcriptional regulator